MFPIFVLIVFSVIKLKNKSMETDRIIQAFILFLITHLQQLLMIDEGHRMYDGNYAWGVYCAGMILFLVCISEWIFAYCDRQIKNICVFILGILLFLLHII